MMSFVYFLFAVFVYGWLAWRLGKLWVLEKRMDAMKGLETLAEEGSVRVAIDGKKVVAWYHANDEDHGRLRSWTSPVCSTIEEAYKGLIERINNVP